MGHALCLNHKELLPGSAELFSFLWCIVLVLQPIYGIAESEMHSSIPHRHPFPVKKLCTSTKHLLHSADVRDNMPTWCCCLLTCDYTYMCSKGSAFTVIVDVCRDWKTEGTKSSGSRVSLHTWILSSVMQNMTLAALSQLQPNQYAAAELLAGTIKRLHLTALLVSLHGSRPASRNDFKITLQSSVLPCTLHSRSRICCGPLAAAIRCPRSLPDSS